MEMDIKDNVGEIKTDAGEELEKEASQDEGCAKNAPTAFGKFKDADALYKAYGNLQAEFTRRSQRLKELERLAENLGEGDKDASAQVAEKMRKVSKLVKARERAFDGFVNELENASLHKPDEISDSSMLGMETEQNHAPQESITVEKNTQPLTGGTSVAESREQAELSSNELYERARGDEGVRLRIIGEYLASVNKGVVPLTKGGAGTLTAPVLKARTLDEAGNMALLMFKRDGTRA